MEDKTYNKMIGNRSEFINCLPSDNGKQMFSNLISKYYF